MSPRIGSQTSPHVVAPRHHQPSTVEARPTASQATRGGPARTARDVDSFDGAGASTRAKQDRALRGESSSASSDATSPEAARPLSALERRREFAALTPEVQDRVRTLEASGSAAADRNLSSIVTARGFSELTPERQREMLDCHARHPEDRRVARGLAHLAGSRAFRESDAAAQSAAISEAAIPPRLRSDALRVLNTTEPERIDVNGVPIDVYGANADELETIRTTLGRLPPEHLRTIPRVVVGDTIGHGNNDSGGAWVNEAAIERYESGRGGARNAEAYRAEGWENPPRLELTHESLSRPSVRESHISPTVLHETGHAVDQRYDLSGSMTPESLGGIDYNGRHADPNDPRGPVSERFADGYMRYYLGTLGSDRVAYDTVDGAIARTRPPTSGE
ncbi:MAG: hypothetical protein JNM17_18790 [Archangium sp.]|nr:hypothetical protein [Archangium sp.]